MLLKYRPEIDGLRAIAVFAVVLYHADFSIGGVNLFKGGFIGVDVFFVISGYLITSIILRELQNGGFSFWHFYERRARRILPPLFTVMAASIPFAWMYFLPTAMKDYAGSVLSALAFGSNIWFWQEDNYAAESSALKPFLHTWSLSVEEQFYVLFPIALLLVWRVAGRYLVSILVLGFLLSLKLADLGSFKFVEGTFYLLPSRGWELLAGAVLAKFELDKGRLSHPFLDVTMPALGLFLITNAFIFFTDTMRHPSFLTLLPVTGTALLIWFSRAGELVSDILRSKPFVAIGLISYSFYLWHFPIFALARNSFVEIGSYEKWAYIGLSIILSTLTYFIIEKPVRNKQVVKRMTFVSVTFVAFLGLGAIQFYIFASDGVPSRAGPIENLFAGLSPRKMADIVPEGYLYSAEKPNEVIKVGSKRTIIAIGDSHVDMLRNSIVHLAEKYSYSFAELQTPGCPLVLGAYKFVDGRPSDVFFATAKDRTCNPASQQMKFDNIRAYGPSILIYSARFPKYLPDYASKSKHSGKAQSRTHLLTSEENGEPNLKGIQNLIKVTIQKLLKQGHVVVLVYPVPESDWDVPKRVNQLLSRFSVGLRQKEFEKISITSERNDFIKISEDTYAAYDSVGEDKNLIRIYPEKIFCSNETSKCYTHDDKVLFYRDDNHLSVHGSLLLIKEIEKALQNHGDIVKMRPKN